MRGEILWEEMDVTSSVIRNLETECRSDISNGMNEKEMSPLIVLL
jgi:hypothetical protein